MKIFNRGECSIVAYGQRLNPKSYSSFKEEEGKMLLKKYPQLMQVVEDKPKASEIAAANAELKSIQEEIKIKKQELEDLKASIEVSKPELPFKKNKSK